MASPEPAVARTTKSGTGPRRSDPHRHARGPALVRVRNAVAAAGQRFFAAAVARGLAAVAACRSTPAPGRDAVELSVRLAARFLPLLAVEVFVARRALRVAPAQARVPQVETEPTA